MSLSHKSRTALYEGLSHVISDPDAVEELLSHFPTRDLDEPVTKEYHRARSAELRTEMADLRTELRGEMADLRTELADLRTELRTEMHQGFGDLRAEMHRGFQRMTLSLTALMVSLSGVTVAALTIAR